MFSMKKALNATLFCLVFAQASSAWADDSNSEQEGAGQSESSLELEALSEDIQALKLNVIDLNRDLLDLEEQLLYPSSTKYSIFVTLSNGRFFTLESIKIKLNGKLVASHLYDEDNRSALARGGVHKLFVTNLSEGEHTITAFFTGLGPNTTPYKRAAELNFVKKPGQGFLELAIVDNGDIQEPEFEMRQW